MGNTSLAFRGKAELRWTNAVGSKAKDFFGYLQLCFSHSLRLGAVPHTGHNWCLCRTWLKSLNDQSKIMSGFFLYIRKLPLIVYSPCGASSKGEISETPPETIFEQSSKPPFLILVYR